MAAPHVDPPPEKKGPRKKATNEKREEKPLEPEQILKSQTGTEYLVECKLGQGGFGEVWRVSLLDDPDKRFAMKTEKNTGMHKEMKRLKCEVNLFEEIERASNAIEKKHFVKMYGKGKTVSFKYYIMDLIWLSLKDVKQNICGDVFTPHTKIKIGRQTLKGIEALHEIGYLHRDIKPANYAVGLPPKDVIIYLLDFGIARPYRDKNGEIRKARKRVRGLGTQLYMSMECLCQNEQSRRDDLEVWMYMMIEFYERTNLLWWNLEPTDAQQAMNLREELMGKPRECLADGKIKVPEKWCDIIEYLNGMEYHEPGDFVQINLFLTQICIDENIDENLPFDWAGKRPKSPEKPKKEEKKKHKKGSLLRKKHTKQVKEIVEVKEVKDVEDKNHKSPHRGAKGKTKSNDSEIESNEGESGDDYQAYLRWKKNRRSRKRKQKRKSNEASDKGPKPRKKPSAQKKDEEPKEGDSKQKPVDSNEPLDAKKDDKLVPVAPPLATPEKIVGPEKKAPPVVMKKKVDSHGTPESNESNNEARDEKHERFAQKKRKRGTGSQAGSDADDEKDYHRKKIGPRKRETEKKHELRKKATKRKSLDDPEKSPAAKPPILDPKKANEAKKK